MSNLVSTFLAVDHKDFKIEQTLDVHIDESLSLLINSCQCTSVQLKLNLINKQWSKSTLGFDAVTITNLSAIDDIVESGINIFQVGDFEQCDQLTFSDTTINNRPVKYYAAMPLIATDSSFIGVLSVINVEHQALTAQQLSILKLIAKDITAQIVLLGKERELQLANEYINALRCDFTEFSYLASHDLKSPLNAIKNITSWIEEDICDDSGVDSKHFQMLNNSTNRMSRLLSDLDAYSKIGNNDGESEPLTLKALVNECCYQLDIANDFEITVNHCELELPKVPIKVVLTHLIANAVKHHPETTGQINISGTSDNEAYHISVTDDGAGIPIEFHKKIFTPFQSLKSKDEIETSGLGLAIARKALVPYSGNLSVESTVGIGSKFIIVWPKNSKSF